jgi:hypothetical protein
MHVDPAFGGDGAFAALAAAAHARGMYLILDGVFNHTSSDSRYFDRNHRYPDVGVCESTSSPYRDWYSISGTDVPCSSYTGFAGLDTLPQLNHCEPLCAGLHLPRRRQRRSPLDDGRRRRLAARRRRGDRPLLVARLPHRCEGIRPRCASAAREFHHPARRRHDAARGDDDVYAFLRSDGSDKPAVVVLNKGSSDETARIPLHEAFRDPRRSST